MAMKVFWLHTGHLVLEDFILSGDLMQSLIWSCVPERTSNLAQLEFINCSRRVGFRLTSHCDSS